MLIEPLPRKPALRAAAVPARHAARVSDDVACECGYNLRALSLEGRCPECGCAVERALRAAAARDAHAAQRWSTVRLLRWGYVLVWGYLALLLPIVIQPPTGALGALYWGGGAVGFVMLVAAGLAGMYHGILVALSWTSGHTAIARRSLTPLLLNPALTVGSFTVGTGLW